MAINIHDALDTVEMTYAELNEISNDMTKSFFESVDKLIEELGDVNSLDNDVIRDYMIKLALNSYSLSEIKEKSALKAECAEAIRKETVWIISNIAAGTQKQIEYLISEDFLPILAQLLEKDEYGAI